MLGFRWTARRFTTNKASECILRNLDDFDAEQGKLLSRETQKGNIRGGSSSTLSSSRSLTVNLSKACVNSARFA